MLCSTTHLKFYTCKKLLFSSIQAEIECGTDMLCGGLRAGIEGGVHAMRTMWITMKEEGEMGFLLIDARNAFNEANQTKMLQMIRHLWPMGAQFTYNCYHTTQQSTYGRLIVGK